MTPAAGRSNDAALPHQGRIIVKIAASCLVLLVAAEHFGFLILEMFLWQTPFAGRAFHISPEFAASTTALAANQGLYNGFLSAGLLWGVSIDSGRVTTFFLCCVISAGIFGAATVRPSILFVQAAPAAAALLLVLLARRRRDA